MSAVVTQRDQWLGRTTGARDATRPIPPGIQPAQGWLAFAWALPIALLCGLIGLGGAECRLPLLSGPLRHSLRDAVPINLAVSFVTIIAASAVRLPSQSLAPLDPGLAAVLALMTGALVAVLAGAGAVIRLTDARLAQAARGLLVLVGLVLIGAGFLPQNEAALIPAVGPLQIVVGFALGLAVGVLSSLLGVAGGALLIPALVFAFGLDITTAGTVSLVISLPIVATGITRFARFGAYQPQSLRDTIAPMGAGSVVGAMIGGLLVGLVPAPLLTGGLGALIIGSAWCTFAVRRPRGCAATHTATLDTPLAPPRTRRAPTANDPADTCDGEHEWT